MPRRAKGSVAAWSGDGASPVASRQLGYGVGWRAGKQPLLRGVRSALAPVAVIDRSCCARASRNSVSKRIDRAGGEGARLWRLAISSGRSCASWHRRGRAGAGRSGVRPRTRSCVHFAPVRAAFVLAGGLTRVGPAAAQHEGESLVLWSPAGRGAKRGEREEAGIKAE